MKWVEKLMHMRTQKSMLMWAKKQYHEAWQAYKIDARVYPTDGATLACDTARVQTWEEVLYYLTGNKEWLE